MAPDGSGIPAWDGAPSAGIPPVGPPRRDPLQQAWLVTRHAEIQEALRGDALLPARPIPVLEALGRRVEGGLDNLTRVLRPNILFLSGEAHAAGRAAMRGWVAALTAQWTEARIAAEADALLDAMPASGCVEMMGCFADALPDAVLGAALGLGQAGLRDLRAAAAEISEIWRPIPPLRDALRLEATAREGRRRLAAARCPARGPAEAASSLPDWEFFAATAVAETTAAALGGAIACLADDAALQVRLREAGPPLIEGFVEEVLRLHGPVRQLHRRCAARPLYLGGQAIAAGEAVILHVEAAQRDPEAYPDPDRLDPHRRGPPLLAFGLAEHACLGPRLARRQLRVALDRLLRRCALAPGGARSVGGTPHVRRWRALPVAVRRLA